MQVPQLERNGSGRARQKGGKDEKHKAILVVSERLIKEGVRRASVRLSLGSREKRGEAAQLRKKDERPGRLRIRERQPPWGP